MHRSPTIRTLVPWLIGLFVVAQLAGVVPFRQAVAIWGTCWATITMRQAIVTITMVSLTRKARAVVSTPS